MDLVYIHRLLLSRYIIMVYLNFSQRVYYFLLMGIANLAHIKNAVR